jgi:hypothetical protein
MGGISSFKFQSPLGSSSLSRGAKHQKRGFETAQPASLSRWQIKRLALSCPPTNRNVAKR